MRKAVTYRFDENTLSLLERVKIEYEKVTHIKFNKTQFIEDSINQHLVTMCNILEINADDLPFD